MESWRKAWKGANQPLEPYEDQEWVNNRREWLESLPNPAELSDEVAAENYRLVCAQWMLDHIEIFKPADDAGAE